MAADRERGTALINVLAVTGLASAVIMAMLSTQDSAVRRSQDYADAAQAGHTARSGLRSAITALRRDMRAAPQTDHPGEPWGAVAQQKVEIEGGHFSLQIRDAQSRFNINNLGNGGNVALQTFRKIAARLEIPAVAAIAVATGIKEAGPIEELRDLARFGVTPDLVRRLEPLVSALPSRTTVNVNTADPVLVEILLGNSARAGVLMARRNRRGFVTPEDLRAARVLLPPGLGFTSDHYEVEVSVLTGRVQRRLKALLQRRLDKAGRHQVATLGYQWKAAAP